MKSWSSVSRVRESEGAVQNRKNEIGRIWWPWQWLLIFDMFWFHTPTEVNHLWKLDQLPWTWLQTDRQQNLSSRLFFYFRDRTPKIIVTITSLVHSFKTLEHLRAWAFCISRRGITLQIERVVSVRGWCASTVSPTTSPIQSPLQ